MKRNHQFARDKSNAKTRRNSLSLAEIHNGPQVKQSPYAGFVRRWTTTQLHAPPTFGACRIAVFSISRATAHHEHEVRPDGAASQEAPRSDERNPAPTTQSLHKETPRTTNASYLKFSKSATATHRDQDHVYPCRFEKKFARTLPKLRPYLFSDVPCRNRKHVRPFNKSRKNVHQRHGQRQCAEQKVQKREYVADCTQHDAPIRHNCQSEMKWLRHGGIVARD